LVREEFRCFPAFSLNGKYLNFLSGLDKVEQRAKKFIELRGEYVE